MEGPTAPDRHWLWPVSLITLALLLAITASGAALLVLGQQRQLRVLERDLTRTQADLAEVREQLADARAGEGGTDGSGGAQGGGLGGLLDGLLEGFGGGEDGGLEGLLEDFGGGDGLGGLLEGLGAGGGGQAALVACLSGSLADDTAVRPIPEGSARTQVGAIAERVEALRGLDFPDEVDTRFIGGAAFEAEVRQRFDDDYRPEDADLDERTLVALGAIPADFELRERYLDLISGQAAGFYTTDTNEIVVRADDPDASLTAAEQVTLAHELEHALSDAVLGLPDLDGADRDADGARASLSLVEGGASLAMQQFAATSLGPMAQLRMGLDPSIAEAQAQLQTFPHHLQRELVFPYEDGLLFACGLHAQGGWDAIDQAYAAQPTTTAQILWPERYEASGTTTTDAPGFGGAPQGYAEARSTTFGAAELLWLLEAPGGEVDRALDSTRDRAAAWDGGALRVLTRGDDTAVGIALEQRRGQPDLCATVSSWYDRAFPGTDADGGGDGERLVRQSRTQTGVVRCDGGEVRVGIGPDAATARVAAAG